MTTHITLEDGRIFGTSNGAFNALLKCPVKELESRPDTVDYQVARDVTLRSQQCGNCVCSDRCVILLGAYNVELPRLLPHKSPESFVIPVWGGMTWGLKCQKQSRSLPVQAWTRRL